jgi:hypothetical protein
MKKNQLTQRSGSMSVRGQSRRFWDVRSKSVLHSTSDIMACMKDQVSVGFTGAARNGNIRGLMRISWEAEETPEIIDRN